MNFDDIENDGKLGIPITNRKGFFEQLMLTNMENQAYLRTILTFQLEIMDRLNMGERGELNKAQKEVYERELANILANKSFKI